MEETMISEYARGLRDAHGDRAIAEAAQRAAEYERNKEKEEAKVPLRGGGVAAWPASLECAVEQVGEGLSGILCAGPG
jgi:hypothetical protein